MNLWLWTLNYLQTTADPDGGKLYHGQRQGVTFALADALCWLLASRYADSRRARTRSARRRRCRRRRRSRRHRAVPQRPLPHPGRRRPPEKFRASAPSSSSATTAIRRGTNEEHKGCFLASELEDYEETMPGITAMAVDVLAADGSHPPKAGPCAELRRLQRVPSPAKQADHLPERLPPGQRPRRRNRQQSHDPRSPGLSRMSRHHPNSHAIHALRMFCPTGETDMTPSCALCLMGGSQEPIRPQ